ncbi:MAG: hypothetical protein K6E53_05435 [Lachnospiraceae bacterium]|nr:hypothetical protein [Lachnospiraceae bacterium]
MSFIIKDRESSDQIFDEDVIRDQVRRITDRELDGMNLKVKEATESSIEYAMEKAERGLEKISNEKIMAVSEYSNTIMEEINKSHKEVMFLYDMLTDKQTDLKNTVRKAEATAREVEDAGNKAVMNQAAFVDGIDSIVKDNIDPDVSDTSETNLHVEDMEPDNNNRRIIELHQAGRTAVEIAKELNLGVGEVNLVIGLFER